MENNKNEISIFELALLVLQIVFIVLKLCGVISWNWWLVMLPVIFYVSCYLVLILLIILTAIVVTIKDEIFKKEKE